MTKREKLEQRIRSKPIPKDISAEEIGQFLSKHGFELRASSGSHAIWKNAETGRSVTVAPMNGIVKTYLVGEAISAVDDELRGT